jgi:F-type H+-transporting ATPase subunit delta
MDLAVEQKQVDAIEKDMRQIQETIASSESLNEMLGSPVLKATDKEAALKAIFKGTSELTGKVFALLATNKRIGLLDAVAQQFLLLYEKMKGQDVAQVITAVPLTAEMEKKILKQLKDITGKDVTIENETDPSLIGGFVLRVGDLEYNASIASKLENLKREFTQR